MERGSDGEGVKERGRDRCKNCHFCGKRAMLMEFADDVVVGLMQLLKIFLIYVAALEGKLQPGLGFCCFTFGVGEFGDKRFGILPLSKSLGNIATNRPRRTSHPIRQRIPLLYRVVLRQLKNPHRRLKPHPIYIQIPMRTNTLTHNFSFTPSLRPSLSLPQSPRPSVSSSLRPFLGAGVPNSSPSALISSSTSGQ